MHPFVPEYFGAALTAWIAIVKMLTNEKANIERLYQTFMVTKAKSDEGEVSPIQTDQAESDLPDSVVKVRGTGHCPEQRRSWFPKNRT